MRNTGEKIANFFELFKQYLDEIYWEGYTEELAKTNPSAYNFEQKQFSNNYNLSK